MEKETQIALSYLLIQKFSEDPEFMRGFGHKYFYSGKKIIGDIRAVISQVIIPFFRDYRSYVDNNLSTKSEVILKKSNKVFIVHGHDGEAKEQVARFLEKLSLEPVILHEQASRGRTIIEKIEAYSDVGFAVVLLTPDDDGKSKKEDSYSDRARQNVLLELGFFMGKLSRQNVCALRKGSPDIPSDFAGVIWEELDSSGAWKFSLATELKAAVYDMDMNKVF